MEFKVTDIHDEIVMGWRLACISDVESSMEVVKAELCGMTFNICSLADGTIGGPGLGYQITNTIDNTLDHKLLITDPSTLSSEAVLSDMKPDVVPSKPVSINGHSSNEQTDNEAILNDKCSTEANGLLLNTNEILTQETNNCTQSPIYSIESNIENTDNIQTGDEKLQCDSINNTVQSCDVDDMAGNIVVNENTCEENISNDSTMKVDIPESKHIDTKSGNEFEVSEVTLLDTIDKPNVVSDLESNKSTDSSPSTKKKAKPMSASMQRLTAKKESPDKRSTDIISASERKAKADELRKKRILEQRSKDDERRAAVLERRKKLEDAERVKKEALFKKLTTKESETRRSPMKGRHSLSTSNLTQLKKNKLVDLNSTTIPKRTEYKPRNSLTERPKSAMQRPGMGYPPQKTKSFNAEDRKSVEVRRPMTAFGSRTSTTTKHSTKPSPRQSLGATHPARPATALGISSVDKKKPLSTKQRNASTERLPTNTAKKALPKSKSASSVEAKSKDEKQVVQSSVVDKKKYTEKSKERLRPVKASTPTKEKRESATYQSPRKEKSGAKKEVKKELTKEEAKIALAERRKKAKEEAEEKAQIDREKDEVERVKREEEERRLAEQLKLEEERQASLLQQLKKEEEERKLKLLDEKEQREREEKERLEEDQRQREEEIDRKAKLELDKIQKEQERQELLLDQERIERKKRVEMIMARVSSKRTTGSMEDTEVLSTITPVDTPPVTTTPPEISTDPARLKVNDILRSRGFGRSTEDINMLLEKHDDELTNTDTADGQENNATEMKSEVVHGQLESNGETSSTSDYPDDIKCEKIQLLDSAVDTSVSMENDSVPSDESPLREETSSGIEESVSPVSLEEAPSVEVILLTEETLSGMQESVSSLSLEEARSAEDICVESNTDSVESMKSDDTSTHINNELSDNIDQLNLNNDIENVNIVSLNDTNNNKDFLIENRSSPINAWSENGRTSQHESSEKIQNHAHDDIFMNGNQDESKVMNGSSDLHLTGNLECEESSVGMESNQWNKFDERMKQIQPAVEHVAAGEEKLWKVLEGKVELSECF